MTTGLIEARGSQTQVSCALVHARASRYSRRRVIQRTVLGGDITISNMSLIGVVDEARGRRIGMDRAFPNICRTIPCFSGLNSRETRRNFPRPSGISFSSIWSYTNTRTYTHLHPTPATRSQIDRDPPKWLQPQWRSSRPSSPPLAPHYHRGMSRTQSNTSASHQHRLPASTKAQARSTRVSLSEAEDLMLANLHLSRG